MKNLVVGADSFPPYQYEDIHGNITGDDYFLIKGIFEQMGYNAKYMIMNWDIIERKFRNNEIDVLFQVQKTKQREKENYFSGKIRNAETVIIKHSDDTKVVDNIEKLFLSERNKLATIKNYQYGEPIDSIEDNLKVPLKSSINVINAVENQDTKYGVIDKGVFDYLCKKHMISNVLVIDDMTFYRSLYVMFNDKEVRDEFDKVLHMKNYNLNK